MTGRHQIASPKICHQNDVTKISIFKPPLSSKHLVALLKPSDLKLI